MNAGVSISEFLAWPELKKNTPYQTQYYKSKDMEHITNLQLILNIIEV
jgi:hypothetical protein